MRTIFGLFNNYNDARIVVDTLLSRNFERDNLNLIVQQQPVKTDIKARADEKNSEDTPQGAMKTSSSELDKLLAKEQPVRFTEAGRMADLYAVGNLATILVKTASAPGKAGDGLQTALVDFGLPDDTAEAYSNGVANGGLLLWVRTDDQQALEVADLLRNQKGAHVAQGPQR